MCIGHPFGGWPRGPPSRRKAPGLGLGLGPEELSRMNSKERE